METGVAIEPRQRTSGGNILDPDLASHGPRVLIATVIVSLATIFGGVILALAGKESSIPTLFTVTGPVLATLLGLKQWILSNSLHKVERNTNGTLSAVKSELIKTQDSLNSLLQEKKEDKTS